MGTHTHTSPSCVDPQQCKPRASTHTHVPTVVYRHPGTPTSTLSLSMVDATLPTPSSCQNPLPPQGLDLDTPLLPRPHLSQASPSHPVQSPAPPPFPRSLPSRRTRGAAPARGEGQEAKIAALPQTALPPPFCPGTSPTSPPAAPTHGWAAPAHQLALPPDSLKAGVVWEEFRNGGRWGDGDKRKRRKGGDLYTKQCAGSAVGRAKALGRLPRGSPPIILTPPSWPFHWALFRPTPLQAACTPTPTGPHIASKTTVWLVLVAGRQGSFWGSGLLFSSPS